MEVIAPIAPSEVDAPRRAHLLDDTAPRPPDPTRRDTSVHDTENNTDDAPRRRPLLWPAGVFIASRLTVFGAAFVASLAYPGIRVAGTMGSVWDGRWYQLIAQHGYPHRLYNEGVGSRWAFFPAWPAVIRALSSVTRLSLADAGVMAAFVFGLTSALAIWLAVRERFGQRLADRTVLLYCFFPVSYVLSLAYTEGLFLTAAAGCLYALSRRWWIGAGLLACLAGLTRTTGAVVVLAVLVVALPAAWRSRSTRPLAGAALAPLGLVSFMAYSWAMVGTPVAFLTSEKFWHGSHFVWFATPIQALAAVGQHGWHGLTVWPAVMAAAALPLALLGLLFLTRLSDRVRRVPASWWVYTLGALALAFSAYFTDSIPRYVMVAFPLLAAYAWRLRATGTAIAVVTMGSVQCVLAFVVVTSLVHPAAVPIVP
jgi:hypothetical protein